MLFSLLNELGNCQQLPSFYALSKIQSRKVVEKITQPFKEILFIAENSIQYLIVLLFIVIVIVVVIFILFIIIVVVTFIVVTGVFFLFGFSWKKCLKLPLKIFFLIN